VDEKKKEEEETNLFRGRREERCGVYPKVRSVNVRLHTIIIISALINPT